MRLLRAADKPAANLIGMHEQQVELPAEKSPVVLFGLMFFAAIGAGYAAARVFQPLNYVVVALAAIGGASAAFLAFVVPIQTWLLMRRILTRLAIVSRRARMRGILETASARLRDQLAQGRSPDLLSDLAVTSYLRGVTDAAQRDLEDALEAAPADPVLLNNLGAVLASEGQHDAASKLFARARESGDMPDATANLAVVAPFVQDTEILSSLVTDAEEEIQSLATNNMGVLYLTRGELDVAREWFARAAKMNPRNGHAWANMGLVSYRRGRIREAVGHLVKATRLTPEDARISNNLAVLLAMAGKPRWSLQQLTAAQVIEPTNIGIKINALVVRAAEGQAELAIRGLRSLTRGPYHQGDAYYDLAVLYLATGDYEQAAECAAAGIEAGDDGADAYTNLAHSLWLLGRRREALSHYRSAYTAPDAGARAASNFGRALLLEGESDQALSILTAARERWRGDPEVALDMATAILAHAAARFRYDMSVAERRDFFAELHRSVAGLESAIREIKDGAIEAHVNLGLYLYLREQFVQAGERFESTLALDPKLSIIHFLAGTCFGRAADRERTTLTDGTRTMTPEGAQLARRAIPHLEPLCEDPEAPQDAFFNLARCLYAIGENDRALTYLRKGLRLDDSEGMNHLAGLSAGREARAALNTARSQSLLSDAKREALRHRAQQYLDAAVQYLRQALVRNELNPRIHGNLGLAYMLRNREHDVEAALRHWQRMRAIAGDRLGDSIYAFTQIQSAEHAARVDFDESDISCRDLRVPEWISTMPPRPVGIKYVLEPVSQRQNWRLVARDKSLQAALKLRDSIARSEAALARLEA